MGCGGWCILSNRIGLEQLRAKWDVLKTRFRLIVPENALRFFKLRNPAKRSTQGDATNRILCWDAESDRVKLVPWPDVVGESNEYDFSCLAPWTHVRQADFETRKKIVFIEAMHLIVRDKCDPLAVHSALLGLAEYRDGLSDDAPR